MKAELENITCEHEHEHDDECACTHEHEHEHTHEHGHCHCHEHEEHEKHGCGCGCCHDDDDEEMTPAQKIALIIGLVMIAAGIVLHAVTVGFWLVAAGTVFAGFPLFKSGLRELSHLEFDELGLLTVAVAASFALSFFSEDPFDCVFEAAMVTVLFRLGEYLEDKAVEKSRNAIAAVTAIRPDTATICLPDGTENETAAESVAAGTKIVIKPGERIPLDCEVISGEAWIDTSALTGEPLPVRAETGTALLSGTVNKDGLLYCRTIAEFSDSAATRVLRLVEDATKTRGKTETIITRFSRIYTPTVLILAILLAFLPPVLGLGTLVTWVSRALIFLVASCPCAFVISVPLTFLSGVGAASRCGMLIKGTRYIEELADADTIFFDKTGTVTSGTPAVKDIVLADGIKREDALCVARAAEEHSNHPAARAVFAYCNCDNVAVPTVSDYHEIPGRGVSLTIGGESVLCGGEKLLSENGVSTENLPPCSVYVARGGRTICGFTLSDAPRDGAGEAFARLKKQGFATIGILSGDAASAVSAVAESIGATEYHGNLLPQDKAEKIAILRSEGHKIIFVGDGINDAPTLAAADFGVAMGLGTDAAIEAADGVLMTERLGALCEARDIARRTMAKARQNIAFALVIKLGVLLLGAFGLAQMWMAVFADVGVTVIAVTNAATLLRKK